MAGADAGSAAAVAPLSAEGSSSDVGCLLGVAVGDCVTLTVIGAGVGADVLFLQSRGNLCLVVGLDMIVIDNNELRCTGYDGMYR